MPLWRATAPLAESTAGVPAFAFNKWPNLMDSKATGSGGSAANTRQFVTDTEGSSPDVEMSPVPEGAGLERAPPLDHSVDVPLGSAAQQEDQQSQSSAITKSARSDTDPQLVLITLISRMQDKYKDNFKSTSMSAEELQQFKLQCSTALDAPALSEILTSLKLSPEKPEHMIALNFSFYNYCGPLLLPERIVNPDYFTDLHNYTVHELTGPINRFDSRGYYLGETIGESHVPCGFGLWVGVDVDDTKGHPKGHGVTIMGGQWSAADDANGLKGRFTGGMLHVCWRNKPNSRSVPASVRRIVGFSYKGTVSFDEKFKMDFDTGKDPTASCPHAVFREFEVAVPLSGPSSPLLPQKSFPLQLWHELFIDTLSDDGLERNACRSVLEHIKVLGLTKKVPDVSKLKGSSFYEFLATNYIGGGLQYFVPSIVKGRCL